MNAHSMEWLALALVARPLWIVWMVLLFVGLAAYALLPRNRTHFENCARIPFRAEEDQSHE
jgi:cytochrome c oxidase cbb3-type subunit IV